MTFKERLVGDSGGILFLVSGRNKESSRITAMIYNLKLQGASAFSGYSWFFLDIHGIKSEMAI